MQNLNLREAQKALNELKKFVLCKANYFTTKRAQYWYYKRWKLLLTIKLQKINKVIYNIILYR